MIEQQAIVIACRNDVADVEAVRASSCGACSVNGACGTSLLDRVLGRRPLRLSVPNGIGARVGDRVIIGVPEAALLRAAVAAYLVPLLGLIAGAIAGQEVGMLLGGEGAAAAASLLGGIGGFAAALQWVRGHSHKLAEDPQYRAVLLRRETAIPVSVELK
ncbi:MAG: SoxR reducing system RseC family protein [Thiohalocapsa sp.]|nr:SoxR reducing system RseC family protein [Thiohalocapsa sp.]MCF7989954.1 SoxR reducing system RseC family protein [Thiohalocapsa sp.]